MNKKRNYIWYQSTIVRICDSPIIIFSPNSINPNLKITIGLRITVIKLPQNQDSWECENLNVYLALFMQERMQSNHNLSCFFICFKKS